jgi:cell division protein FtsQ
VLGGHLDYAGSPWLKMPGQIASLFGLAAIDIELAGLMHHEPAEVLALIGVKPGGPLIGFDAKKARDKLEQVNWIDTANVVRRFPNQLLINVLEREPFVVWQHDGAFEVVDKKGEPMGGVASFANNILLQVVGEGANTAASSLINQMEVTPGLMKELKAAVRVGGRRWDLHMQNGIVLSLPEKETIAILRQAETAYVSGQTVGLPVARIDLRVPGEVSYRAASSPTEANADPRTTSSIH